MAKQRTTESEANLKGVASVPKVAAQPDRDGRQSPAAEAIQRGVGRILAAYGFCALFEVVLASGRRADVVGMGRKGEIWVVEIKSGVDDFKADSKWQEYREFCDCFFFAVDPAFPVDLLPQDAGLILADRYGGEIARQGHEHLMAGARRKAMMISFGRQAAGRLSSLIDPGLHKIINAGRADDASG